MRRILILALFFIPVAMLAQTAPQTLQYHDTDTGACYNGTAQVTCDGTQTTAWYNVDSFNGQCAISPVQTSGTYNGYAHEICFTRQNVDEYKITYTNNVATASAQTAQTEARTWIANHLSGVTTAANQPNGVLHEASIYWDPCIGTNGSCTGAGAFIAVVHACPSSNCGGSNNTYFIVSTNADGTGDNTGCPSACGWNTVKLTTSTNTPTGDTTPVLSWSSQAVYVTALDVISPTMVDWVGGTSYVIGSQVKPTVNNLGGWDYVVTTGGTAASTAPTWPQTFATSVTDSNGVVYQAFATGTGPFNNVLWAWGPTKVSNMNSTSNAGTAPSPDGTFNRSSTPVPAYRTWATVDMTPNKSGADYLATTEGLAGGANAQNAQYKSQITLDKITWAANVPTLAVEISAQVGTNQYNAGGTAFCWNNGNTNQPGATNQEMPGNNAVTTGVNYLINTTSFNNQNAQHSGQATQLGSHLYLSAAMGCLSTATTAAGQKPTGFWAYDVTNLSTTPTITQLGSFGAGAAGTLDASEPWVSCDAASNCYWGFTGSSPTIFLSPYVAYLPSGGSITTASRIGSPGSNTTISTNTTTTYTFTTSSLDYLGLIATGSWTGNLAFNDCSSNPITANKVGTPSTNTATSITANGAWTLPVTGTTCVNIVSTSMTGSATVYFQERFAFARDQSSCSNNGTNLNGGGGLQASSPEMIAINQFGIRDSQNPYMVWTYPTVGRTNYRCSWSTGSAQFSAHYPSSITLSGLSATCVAPSGNAGTAATSITYLDALTNSGSSEGQQFLSDNPSSVTVNATTGVTACVSAGVAHITSNLFGVASTPFTVTSSGSPSLSTITLSPSTTQVINASSGTVTFTPTCHYSDSSTNDCSGSTGPTTSNSSCVTVALVNSSGWKLVATATSTANTSCSSNVGYTIGSVSATLVGVNVNTFAPAVFNGNMSGVVGK